MTRARAPTLTLSIGFLFISIVMLFALNLTGWIILALFFILSYIVIAMIVAIIRFSSINMMILSLHLMIATVSSFVFFNTIEIEEVLYYYAFVAGIIGLVAGLVVSPPVRRRGFRKKTGRGGISLGVMVMAFSMIFLFMFPVLVPVSTVTEIEEEEKAIVEITNAPRSPFLWLESETPSISRAISMNWSSVENATYYSLYEYNENIDEDNLDLTTKILETTITSHVHHVPTTGVYYYVVVASNATGDSDPSNCIHVQIVSTFYNYAMDPNYLYDYDDEVNMSGSVAKINQNVNETSILCKYHCDYKAYGDMLEDESVNDNDAELALTGTFVDGKINNSIHFLGFDGFYIGNDSEFDFHNESKFTIDFWIKTSTVLSKQYILSRQIGIDKTGYSVYIQTPSYIWIDMRDQWNRTRFWLVGQNICDNQWHHVVFIHHGFGIPTPAEHYIDGQKISFLGSTSNWNSSSDMNHSSSILKVGEAPDGTGVATFDLDEFCMYNRTLSEREVETRYNNDDGDPGFFYIDNTAYHVNPLFPFEFEEPIILFLAESIIPNFTGIHYSISIDNGSTWRFWDGYQWILSINTWETTNVKEEINENINSIGNNGTFLFKALLKSDGCTTPVLDRVYVAT